jgi:hypothetical protein
MPDHQDEQWLRLTHQCRNNKSPERIYHCVERIAYSIPKNRYSALCFFLCRGQTRRRCIASREASLSDAPANRAGRREIHTCLCLPSAHSRWRNASICTDASDTALKSFWTLRQQGMDRVRPSKTAMWRREVSLNLLSIRITIFSKLQSPSCIAI